MVLLDPVENAFRPACPRWSWPYRLELPLRSSMSLRRMRISCSSRAGLQRIVFGLNQAERWRFSIEHRSGGKRAWRCRYQPGEVHGCSKPANSRRVSQGQKPSRRPRSGFL